MLHFFTIIPSHILLILSNLVKSTIKKDVSLPSKGVLIQIIWDFTFEGNIQNTFSNESSAVLLYIGKDKSSSKYEITCCILSVLISSLSGESEENKKRNQFKGHHFSRKGWRAEMFVRMGLTSQKHCHQFEPKFKWLSRYKK